MIYELRIYRCVPGRKPALLSRFENETLRIWEKHGIRQVGFWTTLIGKSSQEITYMLAWDSMAEREKRWGAFLADPEWVAVVARTEGDEIIYGQRDVEAVAPNGLLGRKSRQFEIGVIVEAKFRIAAPDGRHRNVTRA